MERIQALIDKLYQQKQQNANPAQLLMTVQLLHSELVKLQNRNGTLGTSKVAVTLPVNLNFAEDVIRSVHEEKEKPAPPKQEQAAPPPPVEEPKPAPVAEAPRQPLPSAAQEHREYMLRKPLIEEIPEKKEEPVRSPYEPVPQQIINPAFNNQDESPTLTQYQPAREVHELIAEKKESLNDRLKQEKTEVVHILKDTPIKDLRKGIGINDRFTFVNDLFRGDEAMYERSIKTINGFHILSEAEYWINRELKFKLGWNDSNEIVQHFYHLVRRRFA